PDEAQPDHADTDALRHARLPHDGRDCSARGGGREQQPPRPTQDSRTVRATIRAVGEDAMEIESPAFSDADVEAFLAEARARDRAALAERLEAASARLVALVALMAEPRAASSGAWSAQEILAHVAGLSRY